LFSNEHSPTKPLWRESYVRCVNLTDGKEIWKLLDFNMGLSIADGYIVSGSQYDNNVYCIGKGPSATTVEAPLTATPVGSIEIIQGTVTDQSPGAKGTPAIADVNQEQWMQYLYMQQLKPENANGVPVSLDAIDPNGNYVHIGDVTSDIHGSYGFAWTTPNVPGKYTIIASFAGSNSYGSSRAETNTYVSEATTTPAPTSIPLQSVADMYFVPAIAAIIVLLALVLVILAVLMLRKRP
jgi:hypothetical protein